MGDVRDDSASTTDDTTDGATNAATDDATGATTNDATDAATGDATGVATDRATDGVGETDDRSHLSYVQRQSQPYTESQVIMATVKAVAPFVFTYGLFVTFHGAGSPGGGFQGGAIVAAVVFMIAFAFGIDATRQWLSNTVIVGLAAAGVVVFGGTGVVTLALGGNFLEYAKLPISHPTKWGMELVEIGGVGFIVGGVLIGLFFVLAAGFAADDTEVET